MLLILTLLLAYVTFFLLDLLLGRAEGMWRRRRK